MLATVATITLLLAVVAQAQASDETSTGFESAWPAPESCMSLASMASVSTDQDDYAPGSTVEVSGSGFGAECQYELRVVRPDGVAETFAVASDAGGNISHRYLLPPPPGVIGEYRIDVVGPGDQVVASVAFMDAIAFANTGTAMTTSGGQATLNIPKPTSTASGDFLIAQVSAGGTDTSQHICAPSGWTPIRRTTQGSDVAINTFYKFAAAGDSAVSTYQFVVRDAANCTGTNRSKRMSGGIIRYTGVDTTSPVEAHSGNAGPSSNTLTALSVNASAGARVIAFYGLKKNTGLSPHAGDGMAERFDVFVNDGSGPASMAADLEQSTAGASGNKRATTTSAEVWAAQLVSLKAAPSGPTKLAFTTPPRSGTVGQCLGPITVQTQNASGAPVNVANATQVALATDASGAFYGDPDCSSSMSAAGIASGANSATFYYEATARGTGSHALTASATGLSSATQTQTVDKLDQIITFEAPSDRTYGDPDFDPDATASSALPVGYSSSTTGVCTITGDDKVRIVGAGTCTVTASQAGDADHNAAGDVTRSFSVAPKGLTGSFAAADKVYDGGAAAAIKPDPAPALEGLVEGDEVSLDGAAATASFADEQVGQDKPVTATGFTLAGPDKHNYTLTIQTASASITPKGLTGSFTAADKVYDGTADAAIESDPAPALDGVVEGDEVSLDGAAATASFADKHAGQDKPVTATGFELAGPDKDNYTLTIETASASITSKGLTGSFSAADKVYDGTADAAIESDPPPMLDGVVDGDQVSLDGAAATASFADEHAGQAKPVTATGFELAGPDATNYTLTVQTASANITPRGLTGSFTAEDKPYDGTTDATITGRSLAGTIAGDDVQLSSGTATFDDKHVGDGKPVNATGFTLTGADKHNYALAAGPWTAQADITPRSVTASFTAEDKPYDGTTDATIDGRSLTGTIAGDDVQLSGGSATFEDKHVGDGKSVNATGFALAGADKHNYALAAGPWTAQADITPKSVTASFTAADKVYDGTPDAAIESDPAPALDGVVEGDQVSLDAGAATASFADKHVGQDKPVTATGFELAGPDAANYTLTVQTASANITPKALTGSFTAADKPYDGTTDATITGRSLAGTIAGDDVQLSGGTATFEDKQVGDGKPVNATGFTLTGADKDNYRLAGGPWTAQGDITPRSVTASFTAADKVYDGTTDAAITGRSLAGTIAGDDVQLSGGTATFDHAGVGQNKTVTGTGFALSGDDKHNYELASSTLTTKASIVYATGPCLGTQGRTILQPIDAAGTSVFKAGSTVPSKFRVCDASGNSIGTPGVVTDFRQIAVKAGTVELAVNEQVLSTSAHTAFRWSEIDRQWIFNLSTKGLSGGKTYTYRISLADGTSIDFKFGLK